MTIIDEPTVEAADSPAWQPRGHPVRRALGVVTLLAAVALTSIWFGLLSPRVGVQATSWGTEWGPATEAYVELDVHNDAHAAVRLRSVGESLPGLELAATELASGEHLGDGNSIVLDPGETSTVTLRYQVTDCERVPRDPPAIPVVLRTPLGLTRTIDGPDSLSGENVDGTVTSWTSDLLSRC